MLFNATTTGTSLPTSTPVADMQSISSVRTETAATSSTTSSVLNSNADVEEIVKSYFKNKPLLAEIARCESTYRQYDKDGNVFRGKVDHYDVGVMQINEVYHEAKAEKLGLDIHTLEGNLKYASLLFDKEGSEPWSSSEPCWGKSANQS